MKMNRIRQQYGHCLNHAANEMTLLLRSVNQKAPEETLLNKPNSCQYSILELRRNTTSYGPISNPQLSTSGTDGATCLYYPKNILWQYIFSQSYADMVVFINFTIFAVRWVDH